MAHALTRYREANGLTLDALADRLNVQKSQVWKWENGAIPRPVQMAKIVAATDGAVSANDWYAEAAQ